MLLLLLLLALRRGLLALLNGLHLLSVLLDQLLGLALVLLFDLLLSRVVSLLLG